MVPRVSCSFKAQIIIVIMKSEKGITLIELLIVIIIVGILAAIAVPSYRDYLVRSRRVDAKVALEQVRAAQEMWRAERGSYGTLQEVQNTMRAPRTSISTYYNWGFTVLNANTFTARATPLGSQASDGWLQINHGNIKSSYDPKTGKIYIYPDPQCRWSR